RGARARTGGSASAAAHAAEERRKPLGGRVRLPQTGRQRLGSVAVPADLPLSGLSGPPANTPAEEVRRDPDTGLPRVPAENAAYLGRSLYTDYLLPVELAGTLLLVAAIGAIAIAHRRPPARVPSATIGMAEPPAP